MMVEPDYNSGEVGSIFTVDIIVEDVEDCFAWQVHMNWSTAVLNLSSHYYDYFGKTVTVAHLNHGDFMADAPEGTNQAKFVNYDEGWVEFSETMIGTHDGISDNGWLGTVEFKVLGAGETVIDIEYGTQTTPYALTYLLDSNLWDIEMVAENGYFLEPPPSPWATDINEDGRIDIRDIARVCIKWGWEGTPGSIPEDIDDDGYVDIDDLTAVAGDYGTKYYP